MSKRSLTEQEIRSRYIRPALVAAGWDDAAIREEYYCTDGRMEVTGETARRGERKFVDYLLVYRNVPLAIVEAKDNKHPLGGGMQQALDYAEMLDVPFAYSSNGDGFLEHDNARHRWPSSSASCRWTSSPRQMNSGGATSWLRRSPRHRKRS